MGSLDDGFKKEEENGEKSGEKGEDIWKRDDEYSLMWKIVVDN